jgi:hypothetical protein
MEHYPCPACGGPNLSTDPLCLDCGAPLQARAATPLPAEAAAPPVPWWDAPQNQRRIAFVSGGILLAGALFLLPGLLIFWPFVAGLALWGGLMELRDRAADAAFARNVERGGGDRVALQAELARLHRSDRFVQTGRFPVHVRGFDSRLDADGDD